MNTAIDATEIVDGDISLNDKKFNWEELKEYASGLYKQIINQQIYIHEIVKAKKQAIDANVDIRLTVAGLVDTINDLANVLTDNLKLHADKTGDTQDVDEAMEFMRVAEVYVAVEENLGYLISTAHIDICSKLSLQ